MHNFPDALQPGWRVQVTMRPIPLISRMVIEHPMPGYARWRIVEGRIVITKDDDFIYSFLTQARPERLLLVSTGNVGNADLLALFRERMPSLSESFSDYRFVELTGEAILVHE